MAPPIKNAKYTYVADPSNPFAPPRQVIEKMSWWERMTGPQEPKLPKAPKIGKSAPVSTAARPLPLPTNPSPHTLAQARMAAYTSTPVTSTNHPSLSTALQPTPFPIDFAHLAHAERRAWEKQRKEEIKYLRALDKENKARERAEGAKRDREAKEAAKKAKDEARVKTKADKLHRKLGYRPLPTTTIPPGPSGATWGGYSWMPQPVTPAPAPAPAPSRVQPTSWMLLPTMEEFGVRRPFDTPGRPEGLGGRKIDIGGTEWPMMSRTMTYALQDMAREERVHLDQAGHTWSPAWHRD